MPRIKGLHNNKPIEYIIVVNKATGLLSSIPKQSFSGVMFERYDPSKKPEPKPEIKLEDPFIQHEENLASLIKRYEEKYGTKPVGRWARSEAWLKSKLD